MGDMRHRVLSLMQQARKVISSLENKSRKFDPARLASCQALLHAALEAIAVITEVDVRDQFSCKQKRRKPLAARTVRGVGQLLHVGSSIATARG